MLADLIGKINNTRLSPSNALLPIFEAIINSFQAIEDMSSQRDCFINIYLERDENKKI